ncbi:hypothetical protein JW905_16390 [bacterium]|nr:hypothetical protein [candidate division CSSED10-310 bacterium]
MMKHIEMLVSVVLIFTGAVLVLPVSLGADTAAGGEDMARGLVGTWLLAPNARASEGSIVFSDSGTYVLKEKHRDGTGVETKGEYILNAGVTPARIDLCLEKCGNPGSEWTTRFGIVRILASGAVEIFTSKDSHYPSAFPEDTTGEYSMLLTKAE